MSENSEIRISALFIDKLVFLLNPVANKKDFERNALEVLMNKEKEKIFSNPYIKGERYKHNFEIVLGPDTVCLLQLSPLQKTNSMVRIELNPRKAGPIGLEIVKKTLTNLLGPEMEKELRNATVSMMDLAVDITGPNVNELLVHREGAKKSAIFWGINGEVETIFVGTPKSPKQIRIYNKQEEVRVKEGKDGGKCITRIESSLNLGRRSAKSLLEIANPFAGVSISYVDDDLPDNWSVTTRLFFDACRYRGMTSALARISDKKLRRKLRNRICKRYKAMWWDADSIWSGYPSAVANLGLFTSSAPEEMLTDVNDDKSTDDDK